MIGNVGRCDDDGDNDEVDGDNVDYEGGLWSAAEGGGGGGEGEVGAGVVQICSPSCKDAP